MQPRTLAFNLFRSVAMLFAVLLSTAWIACTARAAQTNASGAESLPTPQASATSEAALPDAILARYKAAVGGSEWDNVRTLDIHLDIAAGGVQTGSEEWDDAAGGRSYLFRKLNDSRMSAGFDGKRSWAKYDNSPVAYLDGPAEQEEAVSDAYLRSNSYWYSDRMPGAAEFAGQATYKNVLYDVVNIKPEGGMMFQMWFDHATGLLGVIVEQQAMGEETEFLSNYRSVDVGASSGGKASILLPFLRTSATGPKQIERTEMIKSVSVNSDPPAGIFDAPASFKPDYFFRNDATSTTVPMQYVADHLEVPIKVNGSKALAFFDTGGSNILSEYLAYQLRIPVVGGGVASGNGEHTVSAGMTKLDDMEIGDIKIKQPVFEVIGSYNDAEVPAIVGRELLQRFVVTINFDDDLMTLTEPESFHYAGKGIVVPFRFHDGQMPIAEGTVDGIPGTFTIDTGDHLGLTLNGRFNLDNDLKDKYQPKFAAVSGYGIGGPDDAYVARAKTLTLGDATVHDVVTFLRGGKSGAGADRFVSGNIGNRVLHQFNIIFDYPDERMILEPNTHFGEFDAYLRTGIIFDAYKPGTVGDVIPDSPADEAGIQVGDSILSIDGIKLENKKPAIDKMQTFNYEPVGSSVVVQYKHLRGKAQSATLVLKDLV